MVCDVYTRGQKKVREQIGVPSPKWLAGTHAHLF